MANDFLQALGKSVEDSGLAAPKMPSLGVAPVPAPDAPAPASDPFMSALGRVGGAPTSAEAPVGEQLPVIPETTAPPRELSAGEITGLIAEKALEGLTFGLTGLAEKGLGALGVPGLSAADMAERERAMPNLALAAEILPGVLTGGLGFLKTVAPRVAAKIFATKGIGALASAIESVDLVGNALGKTAEKAMVKAVQKQAAKEATSIAATEARLGAPATELRLLKEIDAVKDVPDYIDDAYAELQHLRQLRRTNRITEAESKVLQTLEARGQRATSGSELFDLTGKSAKDRARVLLSEKYAQSADAMGFKGRLPVHLANAAAGAAVVGGVKGIRKLNDLVDRSALTKEQLEALGEQETGSFLSDWGTDSELGLGMAVVAAPMVIDALASSTGVVRGLVSKLSSKGLPAVFSRTDPTKKAFADSLNVVAGKQNVDVTPELKGLRNAVQWQHDNLSSWLDDVDVSTLDPASKAAYDVLKKAVESDLKGIRNSYMTQVSPGKYKVTKLLDKEILDTPVDQLPEYGIPEKVAKLQYTIEQVTDFLHQTNLHDESMKALPALPGQLGVLRDQAGALEGASLREFAQSPGASAFVPPVPGTLLGAERGITQGFSEVAPMRGPRIIPMPLPSVQFLGSLESDVAPRLARQSLTLPDVLTPIGIGGLTYLGTEFGGLASATAGIAGQGLYNLMFNKTAFMRNYEYLQTRVSQAERVARNTATALARGPEAVTKTGVAAGATIPKTEPRVPITTERAQDFYDNDKRLFEALGGVDTIKAYEKNFGNQTDRVRYAFPTIADRAATTLPKAVQFLRMKMSSVIPSTQKSKPTKQQLYNYGLYSAYVHDPERIYEDINEKGYVSTQALEVLEQVYPLTLRQLRLKVLDEVGAVYAEGKTINPTQQASIDKVMGKKMNLSELQSIQRVFDNQEAPSGGGPISSKRIELEREGTTTE